MRQFQDLQVFEHQRIRRLVVAFPQSAILISQEWLTTVARWTFVAGAAPGGNGECENRVCTGARGEAHKLAMKNGLPYLSKELFWKAMQDISTQDRLISGHSWTELRDMIEEQVQESQPQIYSVKAVKASTIPPVVFSRLAPTDHFSPKKARRPVMTLFDQLHPTPNPNRGRLSG